MTLGQKIKEIRKSKKITQEALTSGRITRNMLSAIENDKASPSLDTLKFIALSLEVPVSYLVSDSDNLFFYKKAEKVEVIKTLFHEKKYKKCVEAIKSLSDTDDEISYMLAISYYNLGKESTLSGSLKSAKQFIALAEKEAEKTVYISEDIKAQSKLYLAVATNIKAPLLELDCEMFEKDVLCSYELDFYKFISGDTSHKFNEPLFLLHTNAKEFIKERRYATALQILKEIENKKNANNYNAYHVLILFTDMENCYRQLADFENAYRYSAKRLALMEAFDT